tara:strand:+ start:8571 stop:10127 length:1557 start_codon:yes stop_codon:yes gene_type:complete
MAATEILELEVKSNIGTVTKEVDGAAVATNKLGRAANASTGAFASLSIGVRALGTAIKRAGIGVLIAAVALFLETLRKNQTVLDTFKTTMGTISIIFNDLFTNIGKLIDNFSNIDKPLKKVADAGAGYLTEKMKSLGKTIDLVKTAGKQLISGEGIGKVKETLALVGDEMGKSKINAGSLKDEINNLGGSFKDYIKAALKASEKQTELDKKADRSILSAQLLQAQSLKLAEEERQIRDNVNKTFTERINANERLGSILSKNLEAQKKSIEVQKQALQLAFDNNKSDINFLALKQKEIELAQIEEGIAGQKSEQLVNEIGLKNELRDATIELSTTGLKAGELELKEAQNLYFAKLELARKTGADTAAIAKEFRGKKKQIAQGELNDQLSAGAELAGGLSALAGDNKELAAGSAIIDTYVGANKAFAQGGVLGYVGAAAIIVSGLANVKKIYSTDAGGSGGGGGGGGAAPSAVAPAPQMMSGAFDMTGGAAPEPIKAFVLTDEMSNSQNQLANIRRRATI